MSLQTALNDAESKLTEKRAEISATVAELAAWDFRHSLLEIDRDQKAERTELVKRLQRQRNKMQKLEAEALEARQAVERSEWGKAPPEEDSERADLRKLLVEGFMELATEGLLDHLSLRKDTSMILYSHGRQSLLVFRETAQRMEQFAKLDGRGDRRWYSLAGDPDFQQLAAWCRSQVPEPPAVFWEPSMLDAFTAPPPQAEVA